MQTNQKEHRRRMRPAGAFTLVEIMIALAMLLLIMSFLFQFVIGSQKIWNASDRQGRVYDHGQVILDLFGQDMRNMQYDMQVPHVKPFYYYDSTTMTTLTGADFKYEGKSIPSGTPVKTVMFMTQGESAETPCFPVVYVHIGDTDDASEPLIRKISRTLFRVSLAESTDDKIKNIPFVNPQPGKQEPHAHGLAGYLKKLQLKETDILMHGVSGFDWVPFGRPESGTVEWEKSYLLTPPLGFRVSVRLFEQGDIPGDEWSDMATANDRTNLLKEKYERAFTKRFVLNPVEHDF